FKGLPQGLRNSIHAGLKGLCPDGGPSNRTRSAKLKRFLEAAEMPLAFRYQHWVGGWPESLKPELFSAEFFAQVRQVDPVGWLQARFDAAGTGDILNATLYVDATTYLPHDLLVKVDIASMCHSLEARAPFLDHKVVEFAAQLPSAYKRSLRLNKLLLRRRYAKFLPRIVWEHPKTGFAIPLGHWLRGELKPLVEDLIFSESFAARKLFNPDFIKFVVKAHLDGRADYSARIWSLVTLEMWFRQFVDCGAKAEAVRA
ncbi:MAG: hypothetical protein JW937_07355, partial [Candidatus Omnitrophica bacterium]|nr:hypothetical protein [Candidatus Omnitrophota bacterium]